MLHPHATLIRQYGLHNCAFDPMMSLAHAEAFTRVSALGGEFNRSLQTHSANLSAGV